MYVLNDLRARFLVRGEENKWRGMGPMLEVMEEKENSVYFTNHYWYVLAGQSSDATKLRGELLQRWE